MRGFHYDPPTPGLPLTKGEASACNEPRRGFSNCATRLVIVDSSTRATVVVNAIRNVRIAESPR